MGRRDPSPAGLAALNLVVAYLNLAAYLVGGRPADLMATVAWAASTAYWVVRI